MDLRVNDDAVQALVAKSLVDALTPETKEKLITDAIKQTLTQEGGSAGFANRGQPSPLQQAFNRAVASYAEQYATRVLSEDETFKARVEALFADVARALFESNREELVGTIASTIRQALMKDRY